MTSTPIGGYEPPQDQSAKEAGKQVATAAAQEASNVTAEALRQTKDPGNELSNRAQQHPQLVVLLLCEPWCW